jgi:hypothetical protein
MMSKGIKKKLLKQKKYDFWYFFRYLYYMSKLKPKESLKVKFTICVKPEVYNRMEKDLIKKSRLIEKLLEEYYEKKDL